MSVSSPFAFSHKTSVNSEMEWKGANPLSLFVLERKLGEG